MGYCMQQRDQKFKIKAGNKPYALKAIKKFVNKQKIEQKDNPFRHSEDMCWVRDIYASQACVEEALFDWFWSVEVNYKTGDIVSISFDGDKSFHEKELFDTIAPFVEEGSFIEMQGEDGGVWRWCFADSKCVEKKAKLSWD